MNVDKAAYWRWQTPAQLATFSRKNWPNEIVEAFERHGFIWGGKWWHFDTMHFEYRPEIIAYAEGESSSQPGEQSSSREMRKQRTLSAADGPKEVLAAQ